MLVSFFLMKSYVAVTTRLIFYSVFNGKGHMFVTITDFTREYNSLMGKKVQKGQCRCLSSSSHVAVKFFLDSLVAG